MTQMVKALSRWNVSANECECRVGTQRERGSGSGRSASTINTTINTGLESTGLGSTGPPPAGLGVGRARPLTARVVTGD